MSGEKLYTLFEDSDLSGLPSNDPGSGLPWHDPTSGALLVGARGSFGLTSGEVDVLIAAYAAPIVHDHDDRYFTETETDALLDNKFDKSGGALTGTVDSRGGYLWRKASGTQGGILNSPAWDQSYVSLQHRDLAETANNSAINQNSFGTTIVNAAAGQTLNLRINNQSALQVTGGRRVLVGTTLPTDDGSSALQVNGAIAANLDLVTNNGAFRFGSTGPSIRSGTGTITFNNNNGSTRVSARARDYIAYQETAGVSQDFFLGATSLSAAVIKAGITSGNLPSLVIGTQYTTYSAAALVVDTGQANCALFGRGTSATVAINFASTVPQVQLQNGLKTYSVNVSAAGAFAVTDGTTPGTNDRFTIDTNGAASFSGNLGIGITPTAPLHIEQSFAVVNYAVGPYVTWKNTFNSSSQGHCNFRLDTTHASASTGFVFANGGTAKFDWLVYGSPANKVIRESQNGSATALHLIAGTGLGVGKSPTCRLDVAGDAKISGVTFLGTFTVASLPPAASNAGAEAQVTDSTLAMSPANYGSTVAGGGSNRARVFCTGGNWIIA